LTSYTLAQLKSKIKEDLDLEEETFIEEAELTALINQAIRDAEKIVHDLYEDYFLTSAYLSLVTSTSEYSLPSDIYANKIRSIIYDNGSNSYEIKRLNSPIVFTSLPYIESSDDYQYLIVNSLASGFKIKLFPASRETSSTYATVWYIRTAKQLSSSSDACDIPEATDYIIERAKGLCLAKEWGGIIPDSAKSSISEEEMKLVKTLSDRVPDGSTEIYRDLELYDDHA